jgi:hypothetical protein
LLPFVAAAEKQYAFSSKKCVVDSVARAPIDSEFIDAVPQGLAVAKVARGQAIRVAIFAWVRESASRVSQLSKTSFPGGLT